MKLALVYPGILVQRPGSSLTERCVELHRLVGFDSAISSSMLDQGFTFSIHGDEDESIDTCRSFLEDGAQRQL